MVYMDLKLSELKKLYQNRSSGCHIYLRCFTKIHEKMGLTGP